MSDDGSHAKQQFNVVLENFKGNRAAAAAHLGISRTTLWRKMKERS
jgi:propionate catabolism operon transcriptional regulator